MTSDATQYPVPDRLDFPISPYEVGGYAFGQRVRSRIILWARHLGDDILAEPGTPVRVIGSGKVIWSEVRPGQSGKPNWGGIVIIAHTHRSTGDVFYSLYGHITDLQVAVDDAVQSGQRIGEIAAGRTPENGWWKLPHLHFGIYTGPWMGQVLPGYTRPFEGRTKFSWWQDPKSFINTYNKERAA